MCYKNISCHVQQDSTFLDCCSMLLFVVLSDETFFLMMWIGPVFWNASVPFWSKRKSAVLPGLSCPTFSPASQANVSIPLVLHASFATGYAVVFNRKYARFGHLFQNRYKSIVCEETPYLLELVRYIHLNPLRVGLAPDLVALDHYPWSGHAVLMGNCQMEGHAAPEVLEYFGKGLALARQNYRQFVSDGISAWRCEKFSGGGLMRSRQRDCDSPESFDERILGSGDFVDSLRQEETLRPRIHAPVELSELVKHVSEKFQVEAEKVKRPSKTRHLAEARGVVCYLAVRQLGYRGAEVGKELHRGPTGVSIAVRRGEKSIVNYDGPAKSS